MIWSWIAFTFLLVLFVVREIVMIKWMRVIMNWQKEQDEQIKSYWEHHQRHYNNSSTVNDVLQFHNRKFKLIERDMYGGNTEDINDQRVH